MSRIDTRADELSNVARVHFGRGRAFLTGLVTALLTAAPVLAQDLDICGCEDMPSLGAFDICDTATFPAGTTVSSGNVFIPLPADGVMVFDSFRTRNCRSGVDVAFFRANAANTPVSLLVKGSVQVDGGTGISVASAPGTSGGASRNGRGGNPGPGGRRGGDGGHVDSVGTTQGGDGLGAGGGAAGSAEPLNDGAPGLFTGAMTGLPLAGGAGGGGGSNNGGGGNCSGGGGGAGGGGLLIAANGEIFLNGGIIDAGGGARGVRGNSSCSTNGGPGSGGTIRLMSPHVRGAGTVSARGGGNNVAGNAGLIRIESFNDSLSTSNVVPVAVRTRVIGSLVNPVASSVAITEIDGAVVPQPPRGGIGLIDMVVDAPGLVTIRIDTEGVPGGTTVEVAVKPDVGGTAARVEVELAANDCNAAGACFAFATFDLAQGAYYAEAAATFRTPPDPG